MTKLDEVGTFFFSKRRSPTTSSHLAFHSPSTVSFAGKYDITKLPDSMLRENKLKKNKEGTKLNTVGQEGEEEGVHGLVVMT